MKIVGQVADGQEAEEIKSIVTVFLIRNRICELALQSTGRDGQHHRKITVLLTKTQDTDPSLQ